jgi:hypothetical protein
MQRKFRLIQWEINKIDNYIYSELDFGRPEDTLPSPQAWASWLSRRGYIYRRPGHRAISIKGSLLNNLCFSSFKGAELEEQIKRLEDKINDLRTFSKQAFWTAQGQINDITRVVTEKDLSTLLKRKNWMERISRPLTLLYQECQDARGCRSLVLSAPDDEGGPSSLNDEADLRIKFDIWRRMNYEGAGLEAVGILPLNCSILMGSEVNITDIVKEIHYNTDLTVPVEWSQSLKALLGGLVVESSPVRLEHDLDSKIIWARTSLGLVN